MVVGVLVGAQETKVRPAVVIASAAYLAERPDVRDSHHEGAPGAQLNGLHPPGLAIRGTSRRVLLPSVRADHSSLGIDGDWSSQPARLGFRESTGPRGIFRLTRLRLLSGACEP